MKTLPIKKIFLFLALISLNIYGQGILKGIVIDSLTADQLKGAEIILSGTTFYAVSNTEGGFIISGIPAGEYILQASFPGYEEKKYLVNVKPEEILKLKIELTNSSKTVLTEQASMQAEESSLQIRSNTIKNVIAGKKLQDLPDENIPVALSRLPGVSIIYKPLNLTLMASLGLSSAENILSIPLPPHDDFSFADDPSSKVLIRGLDSKYSNITIDGIRISPTSARDKSIDLSIFSERDFQNIELHKTITSDEDADATAGAVNMLTGNAPYKRVLKATLLGNDNRLDKSANQYNFTGRYSDRFFDNLLGVQVNADVEKKILSGEYHDHGGLAFNHIFSYTNTGRERNGATILLDFITPDGGSIKFTNIFNKINTDYFENKADTSNSFSRILTFSERKTEQQVFLSSIGGSNHLFGFDVDWNAAFSDSRADNPYYYSLNFYQPSILPFLPPGKYYLDHSIDSPSKNYCKEKTASINLNRNYNLSNDITGELKFGGKYRVNSRSFNEHLRADNSSLAGNNKYIKLADGSLVLKDFSGTRFNGLIGATKSQILLSYFQDDTLSKRSLFDQYNISVINKDALRLWRQLNYSQYDSNKGADINSYDFSESVSAGYIMHSLNFGQRAKFITGIRIEIEHNIYSGYYLPKTLITANDLYNSIPQKTGRYNYDKITTLPNFQMLLQPTDFLSLRMGVYKTLIRPDCNARIPKFFDLNFSYDSYLNAGNPDLKNADVWNYEFQAQFYGNYIGQFSINAFYKDISGMQKETSGIYMSGANIVELLGSNLNNYPTNFPSPKSYYYVWTSFNSPKPTHIWGFEIEHKANFRYLPGLLKNTILDYNFTFLRSETWTFDLIKIFNNAPKSISEDKKQPLEDIPPFLANIILGYDVKGFSFRISYFYQDGYMVSDNFYYRQINENKYSRLDIAVKQQILEKFSVILNFNNITNFQEEALYKPISSNASAGTWQTAQTYRYGFNFDFGVGIEL